MPETRRKKAINAKKVSAKAKPKVKDKSVAESKTPSKGKNKHNEEMETDLINETAYER